MPLSETIPFAHKALLPIALDTAVTLAHLTRLTRVQKATLEYSELGLGLGSRLVARWTQKPWFGCSD